MTAMRARAFTFTFTFTFAVVGAASVAALIGIPAVGDAGTLDPRLSSAPIGTAHVWVTFTDKGVHGAERAAALARAEAELAPRNRSRRLRAGVYPIVDDFDLPVSAAYLDSLRAMGFEPHAVSRWLNRAAVEAPAARLAELAARSFVARVAPVSRAFPIAPGERGRDLMAPARPTAPERGARDGSSGARLGGAGERPLAAQAIDHGLLEPALQRLGIPALHDSGYVGNGVLVCVLDNGFTRHDFHEALRTRATVPGGLRDFVDGDTVVTGTSSFFLTHGTLVLGCLAGAAPARYVGAAFGADLALGRTEDDFHERPIEMLYWASGAEWADSLGADIISSSLGYFTFDSGFVDLRYEDLDGHTTDITRAAEIAASKGILVVNAVGNNGNSPWLYLVAPADVDGDSLIAIGAVDLSGNPAGFSSYGPSADGRIKPDLAAPGVLVPVVTPGSDSTAYHEESGTSLSTPLVAGLAACIMQARPAWSPRDVIRALRTTASAALHPNVRVGYGVPNGPRALGWTGGPTGFHPSGTLGIALSGANPLVVGDATTVVFGLAASHPARNARVRVFDLRGRAVRELWSGTLQPGAPQSVVWDGSDDDRHALHPGLYWIAVEGGGDLASTRLAWIR